MQQLAEMSRVLIHVFPALAPRAVVLLDVGKRQLATYLRDDVERVKETILSYDILACIDVRATLRVLAIDPGQRMLHDLGPPQKSRRLNKSSRTLKITTELLIQGSCGLSRAFGAAGALRRYLDGGQDTKLARRMESDAKSLAAYYHYGELHGAVRLRWGFLDEFVPVPWCQGDEMALPYLEQEPLDQGVPLEVVIGTAPGWADPWARVRLAWVQAGDTHWGTWLVGEDGLEIPRAEVQIARPAGGERKRGLRVIRDGSPPSPW